MLHDDKLSLDDALEHYGIKGMKWGVRRNEAQLRKARRHYKRAAKSSQKAQKAASKGDKEKAEKKSKDAEESLKKAQEAYEKSQIDPVTRNRRLAAGVAVVGLGLATYGAMKVPGLIDSAQATAARKALAREISQKRSQKQAAQLKVLKEAQRNNRLYEVGAQIGENWLKAGPGESELLRVWNTALPETRRA